MSGTTRYLGVDAAPNSWTFPGRIKQFIDLDTFLPFSNFKRVEVQNKYGSAPCRRPETAVLEQAGKSRV